MDADANAGYQHAVEKKHIADNGEGGDPVAAEQVQGSRVKEGRGQRDGNLTDTFSAAVQNGFSVGFPGHKDSGEGIAGAAPKKVEQSA